MKTALYGRLLFGASAVLFGVIGLMWHDPDTWQGLPIFKLPFANVLADVLAIAQIAGGILIVIPTMARQAAVILGIVYLILSLFCVPGMVKHPNVYLAYVGFFELLSLVFGALAAYVVMDEANPAKLSRAARVGLGVCTVSFMLAQAFYPKLTASFVPTWIPPGQLFWTWLTTIAFGLAAIAILINVCARLAMRLMTLMIVLFGLLIWVPALVTHPEAHGNWSEFAINFLIAGAAWIVSDLKSF